MKKSVSIQRLKLETFKGIRQVEVSFDESLTILLGTNGVGKTSIIQALLSCLCAVWQTHPKFQHIVFSLPGDSVYHSAETSRLHVELNDPAPLNWTFSFTITSGQDVLVPDELGLLRDYTGEMHFEYDLPLIIYYTQDRGSDRSFRFMTEPLVAVSETSNRQTSLETTASSLTEFTSWFFEREAIEGQEMREHGDPHYQAPELKVLRQLLNHFSGFSRIRSRRSYFILTKNDIHLMFESLSGGEKVFLLLVLDLARRLIVAAPNTSFSEMRGLVFIDEVELHLHPVWQRNVLPTLMSIFPSCQFIVTTHSPQVVGSVESKHVRMLSIDEKGLVEVSVPAATRGRDTNFLLQGVFETTESESDVVQLIGSYTISKKF